MSRRTCLILGFAALLSAAAKAQIIVNSVAQPPTQTLQGAVNLAGPGGAIDVIPTSPITYFENIVIPYDVTLRAPGGPSTVTIDGSLGSGFQATVEIGPSTSRACILEGFTITGAQVQNTVDGGGVRILGGSPTIYSNVIVGNRARAGGGIASLGGAPLIDSNQFLNNIAPQAGGGVYLEMSSAEVYLNLFQGNVTDGHGGGMDCNMDSDAIVMENEFRENEALLGGAISARDGSDAATSVNSIVENFAQVSGGGVFIADCSASVVRSTIAGNGWSASGAISLPTRKGGGIAVTSELGFFPTNATIARNNINGNVAMDFGGGIFLELATASVIRNQIFRNGSIDASLNDYTEFGGGIAALEGTYTIDSNGIKTNFAQLEGAGVWLSIVASTTRMTNCFVWDNRCAASGVGGGLMINGSSPEIANNSFVLNKASGGGRAVYTRNFSTGATIWNSIMFGNGTAPVVEAGPFSIAPTVTYCLVTPFTPTFVDRFFGGVSTNIFGSNPLLVNAATGDLHLTSTSVCIDSGSPNFDLPPFGLQPIDYDQGARVVNGTVDIGADEF